MRLLRPTRNIVTMCLAAVVACRSGTDPEPTLTHPTGTSMSFVTLEGRPHGVATSANGRFAISRIDAASVTFGVVGETSQSLTTTTVVGSTPAHVAMNRTGTRAYTANQYGNSLSVVNAGTGVVITTVPLSGNGFNLLVSPSGDRVYVTTGNGNLHVIDASTNEPITMIGVGESANGLAYHAASRTLYVSSRDAAQITAIDADDNSIVRTYPVSGSPQRIAVSADNTELYIASEAVGLEILTLATGARTSVPGVAGAAVGLAQSPDGAEVWLTHPPLGLVTVVDRAARSVKRTVELGTSPRNVAFDATGATAIVADEANLVFFFR